MGAFPLDYPLTRAEEQATLKFYLAKADDYVGAPMLSALCGVWAARAATGKGPPISSRRATPPSCTGDFFRHSNIGGTAFPTNLSPSFFAEQRRLPDEFAAWLSGPLGQRLRNREMAAASCCPACRMGGNRSGSAMDKGPAGALSVRTVKRPRCSCGLNQSLHTDMQWQASGGERPSFIRFIRVRFRTRTAMRSAMSPACIDIHMMQGNQAVGVRHLPVPIAVNGYDGAILHFDPVFGDLGIVEALIADAHHRGMKVILDYVPNHTSDRHPWFLESRSSRTALKRDWYVWRDPGPGGGRPNNWISRFGAPAWTRDPATGQYYYHAFLPEQPDLNWRHSDSGEKCSTSLNSGSTSGSTSSASMRSRRCSRTKACATTRRTPPGRPTCRTANGRLFVRSRPIPA